MNRYWPAIAINLLVPGSGLIVLRREWLGLALAILFGLLTQIVIFGTLIVPEDIPHWVTLLSAGGALGTWVLAQWLAVRRLRFVVSPEVKGELRALCARARRALAEEDWAEAHTSLLVASDLNDEDLELAMLWAQLMTATGRIADARRWWRRVLRLDRGHVHRETALGALSALAQT